MAEKIQLPNGAFFPLKEGETPEQALAVAKQMYPDAFAPAQAPAGKKDTTGFKAAFASGVEQLGGEFELLKGKLGVKDVAEAQREYEAAQKRAKARFTPAEKSWTEDPFLKFRETLGGSIPYMVAPAAAGIAALAAPVSVPAAAALGLGAAGLTSAGQFTGSNLARQMDTGKTLEEASLGQAVGAAVPQALLDTAAMALLPGVGKLFGSVGSKLTNEQAKAIASQTLGRTLMDYAAKTGAAMTREGITEATQQALERLQAGLEITDPEARKEYAESFIGGAVLGGAIAPVGRAFERGSAKSQAARAEREERFARQQAEAEAAEKAQAEEEAKKNTTDYAITVGQQYDTLLADFQAKRAALSKPGKDATPVEKAEYADAQKEIKALNEQLKELTPEYRRTKPLRIQAEAEKQKQAEQERIAALSPEEYAAEQAAAAPETAITTKAKPVEGDPFAVAQPIEAVQQYAQNIKTLADNQMLTPPTVADYVQYTLQDPVMADQMVKTATALPGMNRRDSAAFIGGLELNLKDIKQKFQTQLAEKVQARTAALESEEAEAGAFQMPEAEELAPGVGSEIMALRRMGVQPAGVSDQFGLFGQTSLPQAPSAAIGQMQQQLTGEDVTFTGDEAARAQRGEQAPFALRARAEGTAKPVTRDALLDRINSVLSTYDLSPDAVQFLRRVEQTLPQSDTEIVRPTRTAMVRGKPVKVEQGTGSYFNLVNQQLERIESGQEGVPQKSRRSIELQAFPTGETRAETAPPTEATAKDIEQFRSAQPGQARSVGQQAQAAAEKRRDEGKGGPLSGFVYQPKEDERVSTAAGPIPVTKRVTDVTPKTLRGPSALPKELSLAEELDEQLRLKETVADESVQLPLFGEADEAARQRAAAKEGKAAGPQVAYPEIKQTRAGFQTYLRSPKVEALRKALRRDQEIIKRAEKIPELEQRAKALVEEIDDILKQYAEYRSKDAVVQANKDVNQARRNIAEIRSAASKATVDRMMLSGRIQQMQESRRELEKESRRFGEPIDPTFVAALEETEQALQQTQNDMALLDAALSTLDGQMRSFTALKRMSALVEVSPAPERIPAAQKELEAVKAELDKLRQEYTEVQTRLRKEAADKKRADAAVKEAERKATIEAGRVKPTEEMKEQLPKYDYATQYPAITEARRLAREKGGTTPELSDVEKTKIAGDPVQTLGGYRSEVTLLEKRIREAQAAAKESLQKTIVGPKQDAYDRAYAKYKAAKSAAERDMLGPKLDLAQRLLTRAKDKLGYATITWRGMKRDIAQLASAINKVDWLEGMIDAGRIEVEERAPKSARKRIPAEVLAAERAQAAKSAVERTTAPATSGEALTRSEVAKARKTQKTVFQGKGEPGGTAKEILMTPEQRLADMQAKALARAKNALYRITEKTGPTMQAQAVERLAKRITEGWKNAPEIVVVNNERELPVRLLNQIERDKMWGKVPGLYDPTSKKVYLVASNLHDGNDVVATVAHEAAGHFGLQSMLGAGYDNMMRNIYANSPNVRKKADAKRNANPNLSQNTAVEEVLADMAEGDLSPVERNILQRVFDAIRNLFRKIVGKDVMLTDNEIRQIVANARRFVIEGGVAGEGVAQTQEAAFRETKTEANALTDLADKLTAKPKTLREKFSSALALEAEQAGVDMRAGLREALKAGAEGLGDTKLFTQTMYNVLKADQKMPLVYTVMSRGPLELYKDDKGFYGVRSSNKNSAVDVFAAINELPVANEKKMAVAQAYLVAQRATNKGLEKLDTGALGIKESDLQAALAAAKADPKLGTALENVRRVYNAYNKGMIDFLAATGAIPKAAAAKLNAAGDYVPFYRVDDNGNASLVFDGDTMVAIGDIRRQPYLAELKGGEARLLPLDEAIPRNTILLTDKALTNMATKSVAYGLQAIGKGAGPADPKTGKPTNKMAIHSGKGPADPGTIRFNQEPDPSNPEDTGERWVKVDTANTLAEGVPTALLVKSLEGAHLPLPGFLKLAGAATDILRTGVTRTPLYIARQLIREPMAAAFTGGLNYNTFTAVLKANKEFVKMVRGNSETEAKLLEKGLIQSGIFTGDVDDMGKFALQLVKGDQNAFEKVFALADKAAIKADAATRALVYENALANGLSEVEADMATMESMNFYKRGTNAAVQYFGRLIPFFNAQIQGLNVLFKAARGRMPFEEQQQIKRMFFNNAMLLTATGVVYAMAMEDDETWRNARPRDKMSNFFIPLPGTDEMLKIPIPFEAGYFYSLAVAAVDGMREKTDNAAQWKAIRDLFLNSVPGYSSMGVPQLVKPVFEVWTNKNFLSGAPIESLRLQGLNPEERYNATTTEFAKMLSRALPVLSPIQIEHIVRGYLGVLPLAVVASANSLFEREGAGEKPEKRLSEMALVGTTFQKKYGGADADVVFEAAKDAIDARSTMNKILNEGRRQDAITFRDENRVELALAPAAGQYRQLIGRINSDLRRTQERGDLTAAEKRQRIDKLEEAKQQAANRFLELRRRTEASLDQR